MILKHVGKMALVCTLLACSVVMAQPGGGGRGGRGGFGGGGFGGRGTSLTGLLSIPEVQAELKVTDDQKTKIEEVAQANRPSRDQFNRDASREEMMKAAEERAAKAKASLQTILNADQFSRLEQLRVQRMGTSALYNTEIQDKLGLSSDQKDKLKSIQESSRPDMSSMRDASREERQKLMEDMQAKQKKAGEDALAVLTADQKAKLDTLKGAEFKFPQTGFGGGRGGNGGPGGGGRGSRGGAGGGGRQANDDL